MKIAKISMTAIMLLLVIVFITGLFLPDRIHVERHIVIDSPRANVLTVLSTLKTFPKWSPWALRDPNIRYVFQGPHAGPGAEMHWQSGHPDVGNGKQKIVRIAEPQRIETDLMFEGRGAAKAYYQLSDQHGGTRVAWGLHASFGHNIARRYMGLMMNAMLGSDFETGLSRLEEYMQSLPTLDLTALDIQVLNVEPIPIVYTSGECDNQIPVIGSELAGAFGKVADFMAQSGLESSGMPITIQLAWEKDTYTYQAASPYAGGAVQLADEMQTGQTYGGKALLLVHRGSYSGLLDAYQQLSAYAEMAGYQANGPIWSQYTDDPGETSPEALRTHIYLPVK